MKDTNYVNGKSILEPELLYGLSSMENQKVVFVIHIVPGKRQ